MAPANGSIYHNTSGIIEALGKPSSSDTITNTVFGLCAIVIGALTLWQGRRVWRLWYPPRPASRTTQGDLAHEVPGSIILHRVDHPAGIGPGSTIPILPADNPPLSPIAPYTTALGTPDEPPTIQRAQETTSQASTGSKRTRDGAGTQHTDVQAVPYLKGPCSDGSTERLISTAIECRNPARPSGHRRYSAPSRIKSRAPPGGSDTAVRHELFEV